MNPRPPNWETRTYVTWVKTLGQKFHNFLLEYILLNSQFILFYSSWWLDFNYIIFINIHILSCVKSYICKFYKKNWEKQKPIIKWVLILLSIYTKLIIIETLNSFTRYINFWKWEKKNLQSFVRISFEKNSKNNFFLKWGFIF